MFFTARATTVDATRELESSKLQLYMTAIATDAERKLVKNSGGMREIYMHELNKINNF
jgi:hypothetical protein